eukprot:2280342-Pyramimonas_sp.AAC.1
MAACTRPNPRWYHTCSSDLEVRTAWCRTRNIAVANRVGQSRTNHTAASFVHKLTHRGQMPGMAWRPKDGDAQLEVTNMDHQVRELLPARPRSFVGNANVPTTGCADPQ